MARRVFFSFHYEADVWRANVVRKSWVTQDREAAGFWDGSLWEEAKTKGDAALRRLIDDGLSNTSVTAVLVGSNTAARQWVQYEIIESYKRGNGILAVAINAIEDQNGQESQPGDNPLAGLTIERAGQKVKLSDIYQTYRWFADDGYTNLGSWVEKAATAAGR
jgi:hypothetical protein